MEVRIPVNVEAVIHVPAPSVDHITEGGVPAGRARGLKYGGMEDGYAVFRAGAGLYSFRVENERRP